MKRDMDLVRAILMTLEEHPSGFAPDKLIIDGYSEEEIGFHVSLMIEAGLIYGEDVTGTSSKSPMAVARILTWEGYEFLESSRNPAIWQRAKNLAVNTTGGLALSVLKTALAKLTSEAMSSV